MKKREAKNRIEKLKKALNHHRYLYHVLDQQEISDAAWDSLKHELKGLEKQFPEFIALDSPTQRVGGDPLEKFSKVRHSEPVLSIEDVFNFEEILEWEKYMKDFLSKHFLSGQTSEKMNMGFDYFCERKIDGMDIVLTYRQGVLVMAATRGNGLVGENVLNNVRTIESIPLRLEQEIDIKVRGEIFMHKSDFLKLNKVRHQQNLPQYSNPRNLVAGSIRQLDPNVTASRVLDCFIFEIISDVGQKTHQQVHQKLKKLGFKTDKESQQCIDFNCLKKYYNKWLANRAKASFEYDGIVVLVNNIMLEKKLGAIGKSPRWMRAYKFPGEQATTVVEDIVIQVGRTGALTPVAILRPVKIMGTKVSRATLHNQDEINRLDVRIKDTVIIEKSGDIIPDIVKVLKNFRSKHQSKFVMPSKCPVCSGTAKRKKGDAAYYCLNKNCFGIRLKKISYFTSKKGFDIEGVGEKVVGKFINNGLIKDASDIFTLKPGDISILDGFGQKSASNILESIKQSKQVDLIHFISALNIRHVGSETAEILAGKFQKKYSQINIRNFINFGSALALTNLETIYDIGPIVANSIFKWFNNKRNLNFLKKLAKLNIKIKLVPGLSKQAGQMLLKGKTFILTGTLSNMSRHEAENMIINSGGKIAGSISKKVDWLILGRNAGSKKEKAKQLGVKIINQQLFLKMLGK